MAAEVHFKVPGLVFTLLGFWHLKINNKCWAFLYKIYSIIMISLCVHFVILQTMEVPNAIKKGLLRFAELCTINSNFMIGLIKFTILNRPKAQKLIEKVKVTERNILQGDNEEVKRIYLKYVYRNQRANLYYLSIFAFADTIFISSPFLFEAKLRRLGQDFSDVVVDGYKERPLIIDFYLPFNKFQYYYTTIAWTILGGVCNTIFLVASDNVYFGLIIFAVGQLALLRREIILAINTSKGAEMSANLKKAILYHKSIIKYVEELNEIMQGFLLLRMVFYVVQIALTFFRVITEPPSFEAFKEVSVLLIVLCELYTYYWYANEVHLGSVEVIDSIINSNWYNCDNNSRKTLLFVMMRAMKPLRFSVGPFFYMSTETMVMICKSCVSYAAAVRTMYARNEIQPQN